MSAHPLDQEAIVRDLTPRWVAELPATERQESGGLLHELVADWAREADPDPDPAAVLAILRGELDEAGRALAPAARLPALREIVLERLLRQLRVRTYALGCRIIDGAIDREEARRQGRALLGEAEALSTRARADAAQAPARLQAPLSDALLEALYAVEGKAMSPRLARYAEDQARGR